MKRGLRIIPETGIARLGGGAGLSAFGGGLNPASISGLFVDLNPDYGALKTGGDVAGDGEEVATWLDQSGNGKDVVKNTGLWSAPLLAVVSGKRTIRFNNAGGGLGRSFLFAVNALTALTAGQIFVCIKGDADPPAAGATAIPWLFGSSGELSFYPFTDGTLYDGFGSTARKNCGNPTTSLTAWNVYSAATSAGQWTNWINNVQLFNTATNTVGFSANSQIGGSGGANQYFTGNMRRILIYNRRLTDVEREQVTAYLIGQNP